MPVLLQATMDAAVLKKLFAALKELIRNINLTCDESGIIGNALDESHVCLIDLRLYGDKMDSYYCHKTQTLGLKCDTINTVMKCAKNDEKVTINMDSKNVDRLRFQFEDSEGNVSGIYSISLINIESEALEIPSNIEYSFSVKMDAAYFQQICNKLSLFGDTVTILTNKEKRVVNFLSSSDENKALIPFYLDSNGSEDDNIEDDIGADFALTYIIKFSKSTPLSDNVHICFSEGRPIMLKYETGEYGYISYYLAPKIDGDE